MKRAYQIFLILSIVLVLLFTLPGCNASTSVQNNSSDSTNQTGSDESKEPAEVSDQTETNGDNQVPAEVLYASILEKYTTALSLNYDRGQLIGAGLNYMCMYYDPSEIGYTFLDTNQNGTLELLVGPVGSDDCFFDLYTAIEGTPILGVQRETATIYALMVRLLTKVPAALPTAHMLTIPLGSRGS